MPEWSNGVVSKTIVGLAYRGFESLPLRMWIRRLALAWVSLPVVWAAHAQYIQYVPAARPAHASYRVHPTEHFEIIFQEGAESEALEAAKILERELPAAEARFGYATRIRMPVVLNAFNDRSNGYVHALPFRQEIDVPHLKGSRIGTRSRSWMETVVSHETVHAVQAQAVARFGIGTLVNLVAPDIARSINLGLPPGLNEGVAVYHESAHGAGRLNDARFQMHFRAAADSERPWTLAQMLDFSAHAFHRGRYYIGGAQLYAWQAARDNGAFLERMRSRRYRQPLRLTGRELRKTTGFGARELSRQLNESGSSRPAMPSTFGFVLRSEPQTTHRSPVWVTDSTLVAYIRGPRTDSGLYEVSATTGMRRRLLRTRLTENRRLNLDGRGLLFARYVPHRFVPDAHVADVFRYDIHTSAVQRLTHRGRVFDPVRVSDTIWALQNDGQRNRIVSIEADGRLVTLLPRVDATYVQLAHSVAGTAVLLRHGGTQGVYRIVASESGARQLEPWVFMPDASIREISWSTDGQFLLFTADLDGVTNVFVHEVQTGLTRQLTHVRYGALDPALSPDGTRLAFVNYAHERYDLVQMPFAPERAPSVDLRALETVPPIRPDRRAEMPSEPYRVTRHLRPRVLLPLANYEVGNELGARGGLAVHGSDPLRRVTFRLEGFRQVSRQWQRVELAWANGPIVTTGFMYNTPSTAAALLPGPDGAVEERTYGLQERGVGLQVGLPWIIESDPHGTSMRVSLYADAEQERWFSLAGEPVPVRVRTGQSLAEWTRRVTLTPGIYFSHRLQRNARDLWYRRGTVLSAHGRWDAHASSGEPRRALLIRLRKYWSPSRRMHTGLRVGVTAVAMNADGVFHPSLVLPRGHEHDYIGENVLVKGDLEVLQPLWYIDNGTLAVPVFFDALYAYAFGEAVWADRASAQGKQALGGGLGMQLRLLHYIELDLRIGINLLAPVNQWIVFK